MPVVLLAVAIAAVVIALLAWGFRAPATVPAAMPIGRPSPHQAQPTVKHIVTPRAPDQIQFMTLDDVQVGMKGYGISVFSGVDIEPFNVEVLSVMRDMTPGMGVVWIRCTDDRMQASGAVQGMSGSPIYLWDAEEPHEIGVGGRLIGAFAFGFPTATDCLVGVQPIEQMVAVGDRAAAMLANPSNSQTAQSGDQNAVRLMHDLLAMSRSRGLGEDAQWRAQAIADLLQKPSANGDGDQRPGSTRPTMVGPMGQPSGQVERLALPLNVGSAATADLLAPLLAPMGLTPVASPTAGAAGRPPAWIDADAIRHLPGSVLSIPLVWGDADMSASGTVTHVMPDGRVLGFGHAMFGQGPLTLPMATGFVHSVIPRITISFKLGGSAMIRGAMVRDESAAVVGSPDATFESTPVKVRVMMPDHQERTYSYSIAHHQSLTPILAATATMRSLTALQDLPIQSTVLMNTRMLFDGGRELAFRNVLPNPGQLDMLMRFVPPITTMMQNAHEPMMLRDVDVDIEVETTLRQGTLVQARIDRAQVAPGQELTISLRIKPYGKPEFDHHIRMRIPEGTEDSDYQLIIGGSRTYMQMLLANRPHLSSPSSADELFAMIRRITDIPDDALFVLLQTRREGVAIGQQELTRLPSSRKALLATAINTAATPFMDWVEKIEPIGLVIPSQVSFMVSVRSELADK